MPRQEVGFRGRCREAVPRADQLAVVAAEDAVADRCPQRFRDWAVVFDGQVADAEPRIESIGGDDRAGWADVDAGLAGAAVVLCRVIDGQLEVGVELTEEEPRAGSAVDQVGVLADPAEPGTLGERFLEHRRTVDEHPVTERADLCGDAFGEPLQPLPDQLVVVAAERVAGDIATRVVLEYRPGLGGWFRPVVHAHADHRVGTRTQLGRPAALAAMACHPVHRAVAAFGKPRLEARFLLTRRDAGDADLLEAEFARPGVDRANQGLHVAAGGLRGRGHGRRA